MEETESVDSKSTEQAWISGVDQEDLLTRLPAELQFRVLSYITPEDLTGVVAQVCKQWRQLALDPSLWKMLVVYVKDKDQAQRIIHVFNRCTLLRNLEVMTCYEPNEMSVVFSSLPNTLKELYICYPELSTKNVEVIVSVCPYIEIIRLYGSNINIDHISIVATLRKLHSVELNSCPLVGDECVQTIARKCEVLTSLNLESCLFSQVNFITDNGICDVVQRHSKTLQKLRIHNVSLTEKSLVEIGTCLNLTSLQLVRVPLSDRSLRALASLTNLKVLELSGNNFSDSALSAFFTRKCMLPLQELSLQGMEIDDNILCVILEMSKKLRMFTITECPVVTDNGVINFIAKCEKLVSLRFDFMHQLTDELLQCIPLVSPNLTDFVVNYSSGLGNCVHLCEKMPNLKVECDNESVMNSDSEEATDEESAEDSEETADEGSTEDSEEYTDEESTEDLDYTSDE